jgi:hypothetical protein
VLRLHQAVGGHLKIYSEPGEGTTVKLYLPRLAGTDAGEVPVQAPPIAAETAPRNDPRRSRTTPDALAFTAEVLGDLGYRVLVAADAAAALQLLDREPEVDLLFTERRTAARRQRPPARRRGDAAVAASEGAVHHRLCAQRHRPP